MIVVFFGRGWQMVRFSGFFAAAATLVLASATAQASPPPRVEADSPLSSRKVFVEPCNVAGRYAYGDVVYSREGPEGYGSETRIERVRGFGGVAGGFVVIHSGGPTSAATFFEKGQRVFVEMGPGSRIDGKALVGRDADRRAQEVTSSMMAAGCK